MKKMYQHIFTMAVLLFSHSLLAQGSNISYSVNQQDYEGYFVDAGKDAPLVFLLHDWDGLTDYEVKRASMLKDLGYSVFAADLFGKGVRPTEVKDKRQHTGELYKDRQKMRALMKGALDKAKELGANVGNAVAMGYCFGGAAALELARSGETLKGFATFHGGLGTPDGQNYSAVSGPVLVMHGTADSAIPMSQFADLATKLEAEKVAHEMVTYSGAPHAFTVFGSERYHQEADEKSWALFTLFLADKTK
jgi:dienelactone hydrolase